MLARYNKIPQKLREEISRDPFYKTCALYGQHDHICGGRITYEHALIYAGRRLQKRFAIVPICARGHEVDEYQDAHTMKKDMHVWVALNRATDDELHEICKVEDYFRMRRNLNQKYGPFIHKVPAPKQIEVINYGTVLTPHESF